MSDFFDAGKLLERRFIDLLPAAVYVCDAEGRIKLYNRRAVQLWGREPKLDDPTELFSGSFRLYYPDGRFMAQAQTSTAEVLRTGQPLRNCEAIIERADGSRSNVIASIDPLRDEQGNLIGAVNVFQDITERKRAEEALRASEEKFATAFRSAPDSMTISTLREGRYVEANDRFLEIYGYNRAELVGHSALELNIWVDPQDRVPLVERLQREGRVQDLEVRLRTKSGEMRQVLLSAECIELEGETYLVAGSRDVTERKRAEGALRQSEEKFRALAETSASAIYVHDTSRFLYVNPACEVISGYTHTELLKLAPFDLVHPDFREEVRKRALARMRGEPSPAHNEFPIVAKSGETRWLDFCVSVISYGGGRAILATAFDVTDRKQAEEALRESETALRSLVENAPYGIYRSSLAGRFVSVNPALVTMLGCNSADEVLALDLARDLYVDPEMRARLVHQYQRTKRVVDVEVPWKRKDGEVIIVRLSGHAVLNQQGETEGFEMIAEDVTERQQLEEELRQAQKMEAVGQLAGGLAHDFSNILTGITLFAGLIGQSLPRTGSQRRHIQEVLKTAERGSSLISQLLAFSRKQTVAPQTLDLNAVLGEEVNMLKQIIPENIELVMSPGKELESVRMDRGQIAEVLMNLVINAQDAMSKGGKLVIETTNVVLDEHYARRRTGVVPGPYVLLSVSDTGEGMSAEVRARVFEPFFTTKPQGQGSGLGLATVYGTVKQNGGHVSVYSEPGLGATFKVYLPRIPKAGQESIGENQPESVKRPADASETILLVEDERSIREPLRKYLTTLGYRVLSARGGQEALDLTREYRLPIDLVLSDVVMPGMSGPELAKRMKKTRPTTKVLYMSGYSSEVLAKQLRPRGEIPLLQKPFTLDALARQVRNALDSKGHSRRS